MVSDVSQSAVVRQFRSEDKPACRLLWRELTEWHREIYEDPSIGGPHPGDYFDRHLAKVGPDRLWVAVHDSQVVGLTGLVYEEGEAEIEPLVVSQAYRQKGIGQQLIEKVVSEAEKLGADYLSIRPVARNGKTINWLHAQGFTNIGHIELFKSFSQHKWKPGPEIHGCQFQCQRTRSHCPWSTCARRS